MCLFTDNIDSECCHNECRTVRVVREGNLNLIQNSNRSIKQFRIRKQEEQLEKLLKSKKNRDQEFEDVEISLSEEEQPFEGVNQKIDFLASELKCLKQLTMNMKTALEIQGLLSTSSD